MFSLAPWLNESMCPWLPGESRALCQVTLQLHSSSMWFMGLQSQHRPALCCLPPGFLQLIIFPVYWKKPLSRNESGSSCAISTCTTFGQNLMHPIAIFLCYGLAELVPPPPLISVFPSSLTGTLLAALCPPEALPRGRVNVAPLMQCSLPPSWACSQPSKDQSMMCTKSPLPNSSCMAN